jgi:uroporphyrin-III C-methyltransferase/precorrin-2 dehydrogenase/sirohydrochlorin ferrochelatase
MRGFPVFLDVKDKRPLVLGSSELMTAKTRTLLLRAPAVDVAADQVHESLTPLIEEGRVYVRGSYSRLTLCPGLLGRPLVVMDPDNRVFAGKVSRICKAMGVPVNVPDVPELCSFALAAIVDRDPVTVAIGTEGTSPVLSTQMRAELEKVFHPRLGVLATLAQNFREQVAQRLEPGIQRRSFWDAFFKGPVAEAVFDGNDRLAEERADALLSRADNPQTRQGRVILVGAGPGDPDLLTMKAVRAIKQADVILYDRLPGDDILKLARREAELINVGKSKGQHSLKQHEISDLIVREARQGKIVVRLKGGDPSIFARGGEELERVQAEHIPVEVIPGITAASAVAASLHIPLTHRDLARTVTFLSGHAPDTGEADFGTLDLSAFRSGQHTLVVYMGASRTRVFATRLLAEGWPATTPVMIVERASQAGERRLQATLEILAGEHTPLELKGPALILCGEVAGLPVHGVVEKVEAVVSSKPEYIQEI